MEDGKVMINVLYEDNHLLVVEKPINMPVQEDESKDIDLLSKLKQYRKEKENKPGNVYVGLIHRLDRPVGGVMVFAKTSKAASRLSEQIRKNEWEKVYLAIVDKRVVEKEGEYIDFLFKDTKKNKVEVNKNGKKSILHFKKLEIKENYTLVKVELQTGRSHQIRVQFSSRGYPLFGDQKYNEMAKKGQQIALYSYSLTFFHPITKEKLHFVCNPPLKYPWNLFLK